MGHFDDPVRPGPSTLSPRPRSGVLRRGSKMREDRGRTGRRDDDVESSTNEGKIACPAARKITDVRADKSDRPS